MDLDGKSPKYEDRLTDPAHLRRITQIAHKQTRGSTVDWQDALQSAQCKLVTAIRAGKFAHGTELDFDRWALTVAKFEIIDLVRKSKCREWDSIDRPLAENLTILDTIVDPHDSFDAIEEADLILRVNTTIAALDKRYPNRSYYYLWLGKVNEKNQTEIARELGLTQSAVSKRWRELFALLAIELGLDSSPAQARTRSDREW
jgi:RNA polymerase sigma factor (sigma-70 family)